MKHRYTVTALCALSFAVACGGAGPEEDTTPSFQEASPPPPADNLSVEGLLGKIDDSVVEDVFSRYHDRILACYENEALEVLEEIEGELTAFIEVDRNGRVTTAWFVDGNLGSSPAQGCLLNVIAAVSFPPPIGGTRAEMFYEFPFEEPYRHPKPFDWSGEAAGAVVEKNRDRVDECLGGQTGVSLTLYVGPGGRVLAAGGTGQTMEGYLAAECLAREAMSWKFTSPGKQRPAKATIRF